MSTHYLWTLLPLVPAALVILVGYAAIVAFKLKKQEKKDERPKPKYGFIFKDGRWQPKEGSDLMDIKISYPDFEPYVPSNVGGFKAPGEIKGSFSTTIPVETANALFKGGSKFEESEDDLLAMIRDDACLACYPNVGAERIAPHAKDCCELYDPEQHTRAEIELLAASHGMIAWACYRQGMSEAQRVHEGIFDKLVRSLEHMLIIHSQEDIAGNCIVTRDNVHIFVEYGLRRAYEELTGSSTL